MSQESVKEYLEYWTSTIQVVSQEIVSPYIRIGGVDNVSAEKNTLELYIYLINPNQLDFTPEFQLQCDGVNFQNFSQEKISSDTVKITAALDDSQEGKEITLSGYIKPSNKNDYVKDQLKELNPELFYEKTFIQNTPPDAVSNLLVSKDKINNKYYVCFNVPNQSKKKNQNISYRINYYLLETDGTMKYKGTAKISPEDNKNSDSSKFYYYFDEQEDLLSYDYTVQVVSSNSLTSEVLSTNSNIGICQACEADISFSEEYNGFTDTSGFEIIEVKKGEETIYCNIRPGADGESIYGKIDNIDFNGAVQNRSLGLGEHIITVTTQKDYCRNVVKTKKVKVVEELQQPSFSYYLNPQTDYSTSYSGGKAEDSRYTSYDTFNVGLNNDCQGYLRVRINGNTQGAQITLKDGEVDFSSGDKLFLGPHTITITVSKEYYKTKVFTKKVYIQGMMNSPSIECLTDCEILGNSSGNTIDNPISYKFSYLTYDYLTCKINPGNTGNAITLTVNDEVKSSSSFTLEAARDIYTLNIKQTREFCKTNESVKYVKVNIKPVTIRYHNSKVGLRGNLYTCVGGYDGKGEFDLLGTIKLDDVIIWEYGSSKYGVDADEWYSLNGDSSSRNFDMKIEYPSECSLTLHAIDMARRNGSKMSGDKYKTQTIKEIKNRKSVPSCGYNNKAEARRFEDGWIFWSGKFTDGTHYCYIYVQFDVKEEQ